MAIERESVMNSLRSVLDPELNVDIVSLGMVTDVRVDEKPNDNYGCRIGVDVALTTIGCPMRAQLKRAITAALQQRYASAEVEITMGVMDDAARRELMNRARRIRQHDITQDVLPQRTSIIAISSGKGGVGKSTVTANLAAALCASGNRVGVLDADIAGFTLPHLLGIDTRLTVDNGKIAPAIVDTPEGTLEVVSMGLIDGSSPTEAIMLRGLMLSRALQHFLEDVRWGDLDYLLIDMPPGTGDVHMGLARMAPRTQLLVVTTPHVGAQQVAARAIDMASRSALGVMGVVENMSQFVCDHGTHYELFGSGGGNTLAEMAHVPLLAQLPLDPALTKASDERVPVVWYEPDSLSAQAFRALARLIPKPADATGCALALEQLMSESTTNNVAQG